MEYLPYVELTTTDFSSDVTGIPLVFNTRFIQKITYLLPPAPAVIFFPSEYVNFKTYAHPVTEEWIDVPVSYNKINITHNTKLYGNTIQFFRFPEDNSGYIICMGHDVQQHYIYAIYILKSLLNLYNLESVYEQKSSILTNYGTTISYDMIQVYYKSFWGTDYPPVIIPFTMDHYKVLYTYIQCFFMSDQPAETVSINGQSIDPFTKLP